jgi:hypothetical protein
MVQLYIPSGILLAEGDSMKKRTKNVAETRNAMAYEGGFGMVKSMRTRRFRLSLYSSLRTCLASIAAEPAAL